MNKIKSKKSFIISSLATIFAAAIPSLSTSVPVFDSDNSIKNVDEPSATEVFSYVDVFENYYNKATNTLLENGFEMTLTFDEFCDGYYLTDDDINVYTENIINEILGNNKNSGSIKKNTLFSSPASYVLKSYDDPTTTPTSYFRRKPVYDGSTYDYTSLEVGDIVYETKGTYSWIGVDHTAIISKVSHASAYGNYVQTIEAVSPNVSYGILDDTRMVEFGVEILRVNGANTNKRNKVLTFAKEQVGKKYSIDIERLNTSISATTGWYCSELVYASWKYAGIDVSKRYTSSGSITYSTIYCFPSDIYVSFNTYKCDIQNYNFLNLKLTSGSKWTVVISNKTSIGRTVWYNTKMAYLNDAKNRTSSLSDKKSLYIASNSSKTVNIVTNWFATSITASVVIGNKRYVTYADQLSSVGYSMSVGYNIVSA